MKKKIIYTLLAGLLCSATAWAQKGVGTNSPDASAVLDLSSNSQGFLLPRMTYDEMNAIANPAEGLLIYCTDCFSPGFVFFDGSAFKLLSSQIVTMASNTGLGATFSNIAANGVAFSSNSSCAAQTVSASACTDSELANGIGSDPDGGGYAVVQIGDNTSGYKQCWMAENMQDGAGPVNAWVSNTDNGWYGYYGDGDQTPDSTPFGYNEKEGFVYQWSAVMSGSTAERAQGICPSGWHIPSDCEWMFLEHNLEMSIAQQELDNSWRGTSEGTTLQTATTIDDGVGNTSSAFNALPAGYRNAGSAFLDRGSYSFYWTSSNSGGSAYRRVLSTSSTTVFRSAYDKSYAWGVRCLKD